MTFFNDIETLLYAVSRVFLIPVMLLIAAALAYALMMLGAFVVEGWQRRRGRHPQALARFAQGAGVPAPASDALIDRGSLMAKRARARSQSRITGSVPEPLCEDAE